MDPLCSHFLALDAFPAFWVFDLIYTLDMRTGCIRHDCPPLFVQNLVYEGNCNRSFTDRRRHALEAAAADIPDRENPGHACFQKVRSSFERPMRAGQVVR